MSQSQFDFADVEDENATQSICFFAAGEPVGKGSMSAFPYTKKDGSLGVRVTHGNKRTYAWQAVVQSYARPYAPVKPSEGPVGVTMDFIMPRPKGHYGTGRNCDQVKESSPKIPVVKPDLDKLVRVVLDALTGMFYRDDSQVAHVHAHKAYGEKAGVNVKVWVIDGTWFERF